MKLASDLVPGDARIGLAYKFPCCGEVIATSITMDGGFATERYDSHGMNHVQTVKFANNPDLGYWVQREINAHVCVERAGATM